MKCDNREENINRERLLGNSRDALEDILCLCIALITAIVFLDSKFFFHF